MDRREFIISTGGAIGTALVWTLAFQASDSPFQTISKPPKPKIKIPSHKINLELKVDNLQDDPLSQDFYLNEKDSVIYNVLEQSQALYSKIGEQYELPSVDITTIDPTEIDDPNRMKLRYTTMDKFLIIVENRLFPILPDYSNNPPGRLDYQRKLYQEQKLRKIEKMLSDTGGAMLKNTRRTYLIAKDSYKTLNLDNPETRKQITNTASEIISHELGHVFGLDHIEGSELNLMQNSTKKRNGSLKLTRKQVEKISDFFE